MTAGPRPADVPRVRNVLRVFRVSAIVTGVFLLLLCAMMVLRYGLLVDIELNGPFGFLALTPRSRITGVDLSTAILIVHGWLYVVYLVFAFDLGSKAKWPVGKQLWVLLAGTIPTAAFFVERGISRELESKVAEGTPAVAKA